MFIYNVKINGSKIFKLFVIILSVLVLLLFVLGIFRIFSAAKKDVTIHDSISSKEVTIIQPKNYTNILKAVHDNLDDYIGKKICFSGYVYRVYDFNENQFVLARDMVISSDKQTLVVGFLCNSKEIYQYQDGAWIEITGEITKGNYHGEMPEIKILEIKTTDKPQDAYVYPPDNSYIPTSGML